MKKIFFISQLLIGLIFLIFGANGLIYMVTGESFIPLPPQSDQMKAAMGALFSLKYLMPTVKIIEVFAGALLLVNKYKNLALILLAPVVFNILLIHVIMEPPGIISFVITVLYSVCLMSRWSDFKKFLCRM